MRQKITNLKKFATFENLPFWVLFVGLAIKLLFLAGYPIYLHYDEIVVTLISKQPITKLLVTILAEPHPPGFYLFLKLMPANNDAAAKIILTILSCGITFSALLYAKKKRLLHKYDLNLGLALFLSSSSFFIISSTLKQESLSLPLLMICTFMLLNMFSTKKINKKELIIVHILTLTILFLGYIPYLVALALLAIVSVLLRSRFSLFSMLIQIIPLALFLKLWGLQQLFLNYDRFGWHSEYTNTFLNALSLHHTNMYIQSINADIFLVVMAILLAQLNPINKTYRREKNWYFLVLLLTCGLIVINYFTRSFVRARYAIFTFFLVDILAGWGLLQFSKYKKLCYAIITMFFVLGISGYVLWVIVIGNNIKIIGNALDTLPSSSEAGYLAEGNLVQFAPNLKYYKKSNIKPLNIMHPDVFKDSITIEQKHLRLESESLSSLTQVQVKTALMSTKLQNFYYLDYTWDSSGFYDPNKLIYQTLTHSCEEASLFQINSKTTFYLYQDCFTKDN